jgi:hypothetical protein
MMTPRAASGTERLRFHEGALLRADDLRDDVAYESRMRGLHVRVLHNTWGVARGFSVYLNQARDTILAGPGIAYDCAGREIVSARALAIPAPPRPRGDDADAWWFDLVIGRRDDADFASTRLDAGCLGDGIGPREERPRWRWVYAGATSGKQPRPPLADDVRLGEEVPIARISLIDDRTIGALDLSVRRHAQAQVRPHVGRGRAGASIDLVDPSAWAVRVDTAAAGFSQTPLYFATMEDQLLELFASLARDAENAFSIRRILGPFLSIEAPSRTAFTLRIRLGFVNEDFHGLFARTVRAALASRRSSLLAIGINWHGVEPVEGCQPTFSLGTLRRLSGQSLLNPGLVFRTVALSGESILDVDGEAGRDG